MVLTEMSRVAIHEKSPSSVGHGSIVTNSNNINLYIIDNVNVTIHKRETDQFCQIPDTQVTYFIPIPRSYRHMLTVFLPFVNYVSCRL